jgi:hypothetical protein
MLRHETTPPKPRDGFGGVEQSSDADVKLDRVQSGKGFFRPARKETEGVAIATLTERIKGETKKYRLIKALNFDISMKAFIGLCRFLIVQPGRIVVLSGHLIKQFHYRWRRQNKHVSGLPAPSRHRRHTMML